MLVVFVNISSDFFMIIGVICHWFVVFCCSWFFALPPKVPKIKTSLFSTYLIRDEEANHWSISVPPVLNSGTVGGAAMLETNWDDSLESSTEHFRSMSSCIGKTCKALQQNKPTIKWTGGIYRQMRSFSCQAKEIPNSNKKWGWPSKELPKTCLFSMASYFWLFNLIMFHPPKTTRNHSPKTFGTTWIGEILFSQNWPMNFR